MPLKLVANVSSPQHGPMIDEVFVAPLWRAAGLLPAFPDVQEGDKIPFSYCKSAHQELRNNKRFMMVEQKTRQRMFAPFRTLATAAAALCSLCNEQVQMSSEYAAWTTLGTCFAE